MSPFQPWEGLFRSVVRRKQAKAGCWAWGVLGPPWGVLSRTVLLLSVWKARKDTAGCYGARGGGRASFLFSLAHDKVVLLCANLVLKTDSNTRPNYVAAVTIQSSRYSRICLKLNVKHTCRKTQTLSLDSSLKNTALL